MTIADNRFRHELFVKGFPARTRRGYLAVFSPKLFDEYRTPTTNVGSFVVFGVVITPFGVSAKSWCESGNFLPSGPHDDDLVTMAWDVLPIDGEPRSSVFAAITEERDYQDKRFGSTTTHPLDVPGYLMIMRKHLKRAMDFQPTEKGNTKALHEIRKIVAVGVASLECHGVINRTGVV